CSPRYLAPESLAASDVPGHRLIHSLKSQVQWPYWFLLANVKPSVQWRRVLFDRSHMAIDAAADGVGLALESTFMMWRELRDGALVCPVRNPPQITLITQWIVCPFDHLRQRKVRLFLDWLRAERETWQAQAPSLGCVSIV
ncbi:MAG TPA: LysR substrate-binding domain-containing protein, partial [Telmatospirillum sp.]|nr:LysR substrate-binding domain-containing protein [Telmatospirillum sp.]